MALDFAPLAVWPPCSGPPCCGFCADFVLWMSALGLQLLLLAMFGLEVYCRVAGKDEEEYTTGLNWAW